MKLIFYLLLLFFFFTPLFAQDEEKQVNNLDNVEEEIWSLEEDYISYFGEANHNAILSLYHSHSFLAGLIQENHPVGKN